MTVEFDADLLPLLQEVAIQARRDVLSKTLTGNWLSSFKGLGMEFSGYREYMPTDDAHLIDWKASLRAHKLLIKQLEEERTLIVHLLIDTGSTMLYGSKNRLKAEVAAHIASTIAYPALRSGDSCGLMMHGEELSGYAKPKTGMDQHALMTKLLTEPQRYGGSFNLTSALRKASGINKSKGLLVIISDFLNLQEGWGKELAAMHQRFDVIGIMLRDPRDRKLPDHTGSYQLEDPRTGETITIDTDVYAKPYREYVLKQEQDIQQRFRSAQAELLSIEVGEDIRQVLLGFFARRAAMMEG